MKRLDHCHGRCGHHHGFETEWDDLAEHFEQCGRLIAHCLGKRRGQGRILRTLYQRGEMPQGELQNLLGIKAGSMSEIATKLESKGLVVRVRNDGDRRKVLLSITDQGRAWVSEQDEPSIRRHRADLFSVLTSEEQDALERILRKLSSDWQERLAYQETAGASEEKHCHGKRHRDVDLSNL